MSDGFSIFFALIKLDAQLFAMFPLFELVKGKMALKITRADAWVRPPNAREIPVKTNRQEA